MGFQAGYAVYNGRTMSPRLEWGYDTYPARLSRYAIMRAYEDGSVYSSSQTFSAALKERNRLYRYIRDVRSPIKTATDLIAANVYQGQIDMQNLTGGALPFRYEDSAIEDPLRLILRWSNLGQQLDPYVRSAALTGDGVWYVVDDPLRQRVRLQLIPTEWVRDKVTDDVGNVKAAVIEYECDEEPDIERYQPQRFGSSERERKTYLYTKKMTRPDGGYVLYETFRDGEPFDYVNNVKNGPMARWEAPYKVIPMTVGAYEPGPGEWGKSAFYASLSKINELNDAQSIVNDTVRRVIEPLLKARNISPDANGSYNIRPERDERSGITVLYIQGENSDIEPLRVEVDLGAAIENIARMEKALHNELPILHLLHMGQQGERITAPGVRAGNSAPIGMIEMARRNLDPATVAAIKIAITMAATQGYDGFEAYDEDSYDNGDMELSLRERPVVADQLSKQEKLTLFAMLSNQPPAIQKLMLEEMSVSKETIDAILSDAAQATEETFDGNLDADIEAILAGIGQTNGEPEPATAAP